MIHSRTTLALAVVVLATGCGSQGAASTTPTSRAITTSLAPTTTTVVPTAVAPTTSGAPVVPLKIMALGDSITEGLYYRSPLQVRLAASACRVDFVGSQKVPTSPVALFDPDHEGRGGLRADQIADGARAWAAAAAPDMVLLHVGTNDFYQDQDVSSTVADVKRIIAEVKAARPQARLFVAQIIPGGGIEKKVMELNAGVAALASDASVTIVDQNSGVDAAKDTVDGAHPNPALGDRMAQRWQDALRRPLEAVCSR